MLYLYSCFCMAIFLSLVVFILLSFSSSYWGMFSSLSSVPLTIFFGVNSTLHCILREIFIWCVILNLHFLFSSLLFFSLHPVVLMSVCSLYNILCSVFYRLPLVVMVEMGTVFASLQKHPVLTRVRRSGQDKKMEAYIPYV